MSRWTPLEPIPPTFPPIPFDPDDEEANLRAAEAYIAATRQPTPPDGVDGYVEMDGPIEEIGD